MTGMIMANGNVGVTGRRVIRLGQVRIALVNGAGSEGGSVRDPEEQPKGCRHQGGNAKPRTPPIQNAQDSLKVKADETNT
jgi:hypothetical protein